MDVSSSMFPGLWPSTLFGFNTPQLAPACGCGSPNALDAFSRAGLFPGGQDPRFTAFDPQQQMMAMMMQQVMQQMLLDLLIAYFAQGMNNQMGGGGGGRSIGGGGQGWSGSPRPVSWRGPNRAGGHDSHGHGRTDGPRSHGQRGIPNGLRQNAANGARVVRELGFDGTIGGLGHRSGPSDHPHGNAIDVMTHGDTAMGHRVAEHFRQNHDQLGVKYVIYQQRIASPRTGWQWRPMADRGSPTANHMDHPHISFH